jgi:putative flippase GtrA
VKPDPTRSRRRHLIRLVRYTAVSGVSTTTSLVTLGILVGLAGVPATWSNVMATAVGTVPSFELNRRWVWNTSGRRSLFGQVVPFCTLSFAGLVVSTVAVGIVADHTTGWTHWGHTLAILSANVAAYGTLWVAQYVLLDRVLFRERPGSSGQPTIPVDTPPAAHPSGPDLPADRQTAHSPRGTLRRTLHDGATRPLVSAQGRNHHD